MASTLPGPIFMSRNNGVKKERNRIIDLKNITISPSTLKGKTPMCLVNEMSRHNNIDHKYTLTDENGPAHKKEFTVILEFGSEVYTGHGSSIKKAQHDAASNAIRATTYSHPPPKLADTRNALVTPTVELNAISMKHGLQPIYQLAYQPTLQYEAYNRYDLYYQPMYDFCYNNYTNHYMPNIKKYGTNCFYNNYKDSSRNRVTEKYEISLTLGDRNYHGVGLTEQHARHNAARKALEDIKKRPLKESLENSVSEPVPEIDQKSPISLVYERALKLNLPVSFNDLGHHGKSHVRVFETECVVGEFKAIGVGNGKKVSKQNSAENMLKILPPQSPHRRRKPTKNNGRKNFKKQYVKKPVTSDTKLIDNIKEDEPEVVANLETQVRVLHLDSQPPKYEIGEQRGPSHEPEFFVKVKVADKEHTGSGSTKKAAKKAAAEDMLKILGIESPIKERNPKQLDSQIGDQVQTPNHQHPQKNGKQLAPGLLLVASSELLNNGNMSTNDTTQKNYKQKKGKSTPTETSSNKKSSPKSDYFIDAEYHLKDVSNFLGFEPQYMDFPRGIHEEYLTVLQIMSEIPQICHGHGASVANSHNMAATFALKQLKQMGKIDIEIDEDQNTSKMKNKAGLHIKVTIPESVSIVK